MMSAEDPLTVRKMLRFECIRMNTGDLIRFLASRCYKASGLNILFSSNFCLPKGWQDTYET